MLDLTKTSSFSSLVPTITSIAFHEREYSHLGVLATGGPDGSITLRTWTADGTPEGERAQWEFLTIRTMKVRMLGQNRPPSVTALKFLGWVVTFSSFAQLWLILFYFIYRESLYHGEETGKSFVWSLPDNWRFRYHIYRITFAIYSIYHRTVFLQPAWSIYEYVHMYSILECAEFSCFVTVKFRKEGIQNFFTISSRRCHMIKWSVRISQFYKSQLLTNWNLYHSGLLA